MRATLRSALNTAVREGVLATNPVRDVTIPRPTRPHPAVWTDERVATWRRTGQRPAVAVWTLPQLVRFLNGVRNDPLAGIWWLIALRGLRRGEATGLRRSDLDAHNHELAVHRQVVALPGILYFGPPKSRASNRTVALDPECVARTREQLARQDDDARQHRYVGQNRSDNRTRVGTVEHDTDDDDAMFTYADGRPIRPEYLSHRFRTLIGKLGLSPIRPHDLRHCAASLALAANTNLKVIQQMLGHSSIVTIADTYTSVLPEVAHASADTVWPCDNYRTVGQVDWCCPSNHRPGPAEVTFLSAFNVTVTSPPTASSVACRASPMMGSWSQRGAPWRRHDRPAFDGRRTRTIWPGLPGRAVEAGPPAMPDLLPVPSALGWRAPLSLPPLLADLDRVCGCLIVLHAAPVQLVGIVAPGRRGLIGPASTA